MRALPHVTVATVVQRQGRYLMVREKADGRLVYNQPAGHVEVGESLCTAATRETLEETGWRVVLTALLGIYQHTSPDNGVTYIRHCFLADAVAEDPDATLDKDIEAALWLSEEELEEDQASLRSPMVLQAIRDHRAGISFPLSLIHEQQY